MAKRLFNVEAVFEIEDRGIVVVSDQTYETIPPDRHIRIGDLVRIQRTDDAGLVTKVIGIEHFNPLTRKHPVAFLISNVSKDDVPTGAEVWSVDAESE
jgi:hypothetical protein